MDGLPLIALVIASLAVTALCRRWGLGPPLPLVLAGIAASAIPGVPDFSIEPDVVLALVLTPLLYSAALDSSYLGFRANLRQIGLLAVGLVIFSTVVVGLVTWWVAPGLGLVLPLGSALVLGAVVAPPDAVAAIAVGRRLGLPRRIMTILGGESLVNDAAALTLFRVAVAGAGGGAVGGAAAGSGSAGGAAGQGMSLAHAAGMFLLAGVGGVVIGLAAAWVVHRIRLWLNDALIESAFGLVVPFVVYALAEGAHSSGLLAVVVAGLYLGHRAPETGFATRLQDDAVWRASDTVLESVVFALIGLQLTAILGQVREVGPALLVGLVVTATAVVARVVWVFPATYVPRLLVPSIRRTDPYPRWQVPAVIAWSGMRGVVSLAAAFAIPESVPGRPELLFLTFCVTVGTLLLHGLTLPWLIRRLGVQGVGESQADALAEAQAQYAAGRAAMTRLDELTENGDAEPRSVQKLKRMAEMRTNSSWERLGRDVAETGEGPGATYRRLRREMLTAERDTFVQHRNEGRIDDEVLRRVLRELDLEEAMLSRDD
ncbi:MAG TPA: cation:proton antiporter [Pseudonocardia sp.]|nr:cation:proton antiporter [Pseudonocardia sp.]